MYQLTNLVKRNIKVFLKDKTAVFFSFLSVIILLTLYFLFLNNSYSGSFTGLGLDAKVENFIVLSQMMGGILVINTLTQAVGTMGNLVNDNYYNKMDSFLVTPVSRVKIVLSYFISTVIVTFVFTFLMWILIIGYVYINTGFLYNFSTIITITLLIFLYTLISSSIMLFIVSFIKSVSAFGAFSGIFGTLIGFTSGIYMPLAILPNAISKVSSLIPFTHMTILLKNVMLKQPLSLIKNDVPEEAYNQITKFMGSDQIGILGMKIDISIIIIFIIVGSILLFLFNVNRLTRKFKK